MRQCSRRTLALFVRRCQTAEEKSSWRTGASGQAHRCTPADDQETSKCFLLAVVDDCTEVGCKDGATWVALLQLIRSNNEIASYFSWLSITKCLCRGATHYSTAFLFVCMIYFFLLLNFLTFWWKKTDRHFLNACEEKCNNDLMLGLPAARIKSMKMSDWLSAVYLSLFRLWWTNTVFYTDTKFNKYARSRFRSTEPAWSTSKLFGKIKPGQRDLLWIWHLMVTLCGQLDDDLSQWSVNELSTGH